MYARTFSHVHTGRGAHWAVRATSSKDALTGAVPLHDLIAKMQTAFARLPKDLRHPRAVCSVAVASRAAPVLYLDLAASFAGSILVSTRRSCKDADAGFGEETASTDHTAKMLASDSREPEAM